MHSDRNIRPLYEQVRDALRDQLVAGRYVGGDRLPTEAELAGQWDVSVITVRRAVGDLVQEGWLTRRQGKGTYVRAPRLDHDLTYLTDFVEDMRRAGLDATSRVLHFAPEPAPADVAGALGPAPGTPVLRFDRLRLADGEPIAVDQTWLPLRFALYIERSDVEEATVFEILERRFGTPVDVGEHVLDAALADPTLANLLGVPVGAALLVLERTSRSGGIPVCFQRRYYRRDQVRYRITVRRASPVSAAVHRESVEHFGPVFAGHQPDR